jgi:hypothetical protein
MNKNNNLRNPDPGFLGFLALCDKERAKFQIEVLVLEDLEVLRLEDLHFAACEEYLALFAASHLD